MHTLSYVSSCNIGFIHRDRNTLPLSWMIYQYSCAMCRSVVRIKAPVSQDYLFFWNSFYDINLFLAWSIFTKCKLSKKKTAFFEYNKKNREKTKTNFPLFGKKIN